MNAHLFPSVQDEMADKLDEAKFRDAEADGDSENDGNTEGNVIDMEKFMRRGDDNNERKAKG